MTITKNDINYLIKIILTWTFLNFSLNLLSLWIRKLIDEESFNFIENVSNEFLRPLLIQALIFAIIFSIAYVFLNTRKITIYVFVFFQAFVFHLIFFFNLKTTNMIHFETLLDDSGLKYLSNMGQYLVDILFIYLPLEGIFKNNVFIPKNTGLFYLQWIFLVLLYFAFLSYLTPKVIDFFNYKQLPTPIQKATPTEVIEIVEESENFLP
jgi:hypothetical protein